MGHYIYFHKQMYIPFIYLYQQCECKSFAFRSVKDVQFQVLLDAMFNSVMLVALLIFVSPHWALLHNKCYTSVKNTVASAYVDMWFCVIRLQFWYLSTKLLCILMLWCLKHCTAAAWHVWSKPECKFRACEFLCSKCPCPCSCREVSTKWTRPIFTER